MTVINSSEARTAARVSSTSPRTNRAKSSRLRGRLPGIMLIVAAAIFSIVPLISMLTAALAPQGSIPQGLSWPADPQWHNFIDAWNVANITVLLQSSILIVLGVVPISLLISTMAAYAIAVLRIPLGRIFFLLLLLTLTLPYEITIVPLYQQVRELGLLDSQLGLILPLIGLNMPFAVFWMNAHFVTTPAELTEASSIDGASAWKSFLHIHLPLAKPAISSLGLLMFLSTWNTFLLALVLINDPNKRTMAGALQAFQSKYSTDIVLLNAGALLLMAPTIIVFLLLQKQFSAALLQGAVKG
ncbi:carbohydrate ABC transporter permease [Pseudarthrobacter sulfonivorans]|uniref:carbohydrate ABC transporter permease n=1 Tax=Pseudarthrobacter sulfonivorans TaxID=121292 RepID=UPI00285F4818|nr:carbohydrate ABC transporter permease [Pseudarthrobacter sulfonivorans]MDR6415295.1 raffinose/stachyose/melibiose transport system permease protein [Pseudarthrobacter sulfonivorans]